MVFVLIRATTLDDKSFTALIKHLGDAGHKFVARHAFEEAHADVTRVHRRSLSSAAARRPPCNKARCGSSRPSWLCLVTAYREYGLRIKSPTFPAVAADTVAAS